MPPVPDILALGRVGVDLYPRDLQRPLDEVRTFEKFLGGSAGNVAVAAARHGRHAALFSRTGADPFGRFVRSELARLGVDTRHVGIDEKLPTPVTFCEIFPPDDFPLYFYRYPQAPDLTICPEDVPADEVASAGVLWATLTGLSAQPSRRAHEQAWRLRGRRSQTIIDLDYRPMFWADERDATEAAAAALEHSTVAIGNAEECRVAVGETDPERAARALLERGIDIAVVKQGPRGVLAMTASERVDCPAFPVQVVNGLGAGDAFGGALCHGVLAGWSLERVIRFASAAGAIVAGRLECASAMPDENEVAAFAQTATEVAAADHSSPESTETLDRSSGGAR